MLIARLARAPAALAILWPALLVVAAYVAWHRWGAEHVGRQYHRLDPSQIRLSEKPGYIRSDITRSVVASTGLDRLSLLDQQATARIAQAYSTNPWIQQVVRVRKLPGGEVDIQVQYRTPVAMVRVWSRHQEVQGWSFFPVDITGTLLPTEEFDRSQPLQYLHIEIPDVYPTGQAGLPFGDSRVAAAAKLAGLLSPHRQRFGLAAIRLANAGPGESRTVALEVVMQSGQSLVWGSPPGDEQPGEPDALAKLEALRAAPGPGADLRVAAMSPESL